MRALVTLGCCLALAACNALPGYRFPTGPVAQPELTSATLNRPFPIRADRASEYVQNGRITRYEKLSLYHPHCMFGLRTIATTARTVQPDTFTITGIHRDRFMAWAGGQMLASGDSDFGMVMSKTTLDLHSDSQPGVFRLTCQQLDEAYRARHLSVPEMQQALGDLFTLQ